MKELLHTPIFNVVELDEVEPGFKPVAIDAPDWVSIIVERDNKFIVVEQLRYGVMDETLEFPSGTVENGEDPKSAAARELLEETGIRVNKDNLKCICCCSPNPAFMMNKKYIYYVNIDEIPFKEEEQKLDEHEHIRCMWKDKFDLTKMTNKYSSTQPAMYATAILAYWDYKGIFNTLEGIKRCLM